MTEQEYKNKLNKIEADYGAALNALYIEYAISNAVYKRGDIIKDGDRVILVDKITTYKGFNFPEAVYHGLKLKKDLTPTKKMERDSLYSSHGLELVKKGTTE